MKKVLLLTSFALLFVACKKDPNQTETEQGSKKLVLKAIEMLDDGEKTRIEYIYGANHQLIEEKGTLNGTPYFSYFFNYQDGILKESYGMYPNTQTKVNILSYSYSTNRIIVSSQQKQGQISNYDQVDTLFLKDGKIERIQESYYINDTLKKGAVTEYFWANGNVVKKKKQENNNDCFNEIYYSYNDKLNVENLIPNNSQTEYGKYGISKNIAISRYDQTFCPTTTYPATNHFDWSYKYNSNGYPSEKLNKDGTTDLWFIYEEI